MEPNAVAAGVAMTNARPTATAAFRTMLLAVAVMAGSSLSSSNVLQAQAANVTVTNGASPLVVSGARAGLAPDGASDSGTRISLVVTEPASRLLVHTDEPLPSGLTIEVRAEAPIGAISLGSVTLDRTPQELLRGIPIGSYAGLILTYSIVAQTSAGVVPPSSLNVSFTLSSGI